MPGLLKTLIAPPRIVETFDCLNWVEWFSSLDLRLEYWQVEMEEDSKTLTAFTVRPLEFYKCECRPFGLTNDPTTFQWFMQSCLGNLHLHYCIIYLDDVTVFSKKPEEHVVRFEGRFQKAQTGSIET